MRVIGELAGAAVAVECENTRQVIWVSLARDPQPGPVMALMQLIAPVVHVRLDDGSRWAVGTYSDAVDQRIVEMVDLLTALRVNNPHFMQLPLVGMEL